MTILEILLRLQKEGPQEPQCGICLNFHFLLGDSPGSETILTEFRRFYRIYVVGWPEFSGDVQYPVPSLKEDYTPEEYYGLLDDVWEGDYGDSRRRLLNYLIECAKNLELGSNIYKI